MAGGAVLNCILINEFNTSTQDLDFFWLGGSWILFIKAIDRFKRKVQSRILEEKNIHGILIEFVLSMKENHKLRIQFIFGRENSNISFILHTFDLDNVQVGFDGSKVVSVCQIEQLSFLFHLLLKTLGFLQAVATRSFISYRVTNNNNDAIYYLDRCLKYNMRGFS
ncbi:unnamed protein product [Rotaria sordida]|uniref:Uncharacterized protein n=1 Tax=Rotaria sordida TaxID=392033 RepID=A0A814WAI3_9BILA|nr:unnamed protein product [Rotaria sordida]CAF1476778.1 unnamed protein product [Rotaria sordida]